MNVKKLLSTRRFIPAYAGNSAGKVLRRRSLTVHPRLRGELERFNKQGVSIGGSSPLTRGTQAPEVVPVPYPRFIPAYAGNSEENRDFDRYITVHPRLRGELFIPAYAGNSEGQSIRAGSETVHPRLRGELMHRI